MKNWMETCRILMRRSDLDEMSGKIRNYGRQKMDGWRDWTDDERRRRWTD